MEPSGAKIDSMNIIPVAVDVQVRRATENLGVTNTRGLPLKEAKQRTQSAWHATVAEARIGGPSGIKGTSTSASWPSASLHPKTWNMNPLRLVPSLRHLIYLRFLRSMKGTYSGSRFVARQLPSGDGSTQTCVGWEVFSHPFEFCCRLT